MSLYQLNGCVLFLSQSKLIDWCHWGTAGLILLSYKSLSFQHHSGKQWAVLERGKEREVTARSRERWREREKISPNSPLFHRGVKYNQHLRGPFVQNQPTSNTGARAGIHPQIKEIKSHRSAPTIQHYTIQKCNTFPLWKQQGAWVKWEQKRQNNDMTLG